MIIENSFTVAAPRDAVAAYFLDAEQALRCVPGVSGITKTGDGAYSATLAAKVGPIKASFGGNITYDATNAPATIRATGEGRDRASGSMARVILDATFSEDEPDHTLVKTHADLSIRGRFGQFGTGVIQAIADEMIGAFARCLEASITGGEPADASATSGSGSLVAAAARGLVRGSTAKLTGKRPASGEESA